MGSKFICVRGPWTSFAGHPSPTSFLVSLLAVSLCRRRQMAMVSDSDKESDDVHNPPGKVDGRGQASRWEPMHEVAEDDLHRFWADHAPAPFSGGR
jgi:hypothetical protein